MVTQLDWSYTLSEIPEDGLSSRRSASAEQRAALAAELDLLDCKRLDVRYEIRPLSHGRYRLTGKLEADVTQNCVVSLEPVDSHIHEPIDVEFRPGERPSGDFDALDDREIEPLEDGGVIPVGRIVYELLSSSLDPYPRKEGIELQPESSAPDGPEARDNPFAVLKNLKPGA